MGLIYRFNDSLLNHLNIPPDSDKRNNYFILSVIVNAIQTVPLIKNVEGKYKWQKMQTTNLNSPDSISIDIFNYNFWGKRGCLGIIILHQNCIGFVYDLNFK